MKRIAIPLIAALGAAGIAVAAFPAHAGQDTAAPGGDAQNLAMIPMVTLNRAVDVEGPYVRLGDLFQGAGEHADKPVAHAPEPGKRTVLDAAWLYKVAAAYGLDWRPTTQFDNATVARPSLVVESEQIVDALRAALERDGLMPESAEVSLNNGNTRIHLPVGTSTDIGVSDLSLDDRTRQFTASVEIPAGAPDAKRLRVAGRVFVIEEVPVLTRNIGRGEVIAEADLKWTQQRAKQVRQGTVVDASELIGKSATRFLRAGMTVQTRDVQHPLLVEKGNVVTMILQTPMMMLTTQGRAMEDGAAGDTVRVLNLKSRATILATVTDHNTVTVQPLAQAAAN